MKPTLIIVLLLVSSCSTERICRKAKEKGCYTISDSVRVDSFERIVTKTDTFKSVEILKEYIRDSAQADSNDVITIKKYRYKGFVGTLIINWEKHTHDFDGVILNENKKERVKSVDSVSSKKKESETKTIIVKPDCPKDRFWLGFVLGMIFILFLIVLVFKTIIWIGKTPDNNTH